MRIKRLFLTEINCDLAVAQSKIASAAALPPRCSCQPSALNCE